MPKHPTSHTDRGTAATTKLVGDGSSSETKRCPVCGETIWVNALKCTHCDTDFTWRRTLTFSNTTLALITALISVIAASAPALHVLMTPDNSKLSGVFVGASTSGKTISMLFSNNGRRMGAINKVWYAVLYMKGNELRRVEIYPHTEHDQSIHVDPEKTVPGEFLLSSSVIHWFPEKAAQEDLQLLSSLDFWTGFDAQGATCHVFIEGRNADGSPFKQEMNIPCMGNAFQIFRELAVESKGKSLD
jgi:hypothetical protein